MTEDERWYFLERARVSLEMGQKATDPHIAGIHLDMYERYMALAARRGGANPVIRPLPQHG